uniref:Uncharacterized protein n=1 Tax=Anguilla anguilla TaxID=7936 RepID=A0A0E9TUR7_ANGAN
MISSPSKCNNSKTMHFCKHSQLPPGGSVESFKMLLG